MTVQTTVDDVDDMLPSGSLLIFGLQHVLVMAALPITAVFLVGKALGLSPELTINLISATFLVCGLGTLLQSFGPWKFGARLPFIMVPGGAPIVMFLTIAQQTDLQTACGAVILTALFYFLVLPVFARCLQVLSEDRDRHACCCWCRSIWSRSTAASSPASPARPASPTRRISGWRWRPSASRVLFARIFSGMLRPTGGAPGAAGRRAGCGICSG